MFEKFISYLKFEKRYSAHTLKAYERDLNDFLVYADIKRLNEFSDLSASYIRSWIVHLIFSIVPRCLFFESPTNEYSKVYRLSSVLKIRI